jgi:hypothetical protein
MSLFKNGKCYRRRPDLVGDDGQPFRNYQTLQSAIDNEGFPRGRLVGRIRVWTGDELNEWWDTRPTETMKLPKGFGGVAAAEAKQRKRKAQRQAA